MNTPPRPGSLLASYGISYHPALQTYLPQDGLSTPRLLISPLPPTTPLSALLSHIWGGRIVSAHILPDPVGRGVYVGLVEFARAECLREYLRDMERWGLMVECPGGCYRGGGEIDYEKDGIVKWRVQIIGTDSYPMGIAMRGRIKQGHTRYLVIPSVPERQVGILLRELGLLEQSTAETIVNLWDEKTYDSTTNHETGRIDVHIVFSRQEITSRIFGILKRSMVGLPETVRFRRDPCDRGVILEEGKRFARVGRDWVREYLGTVRGEVGLGKAKKEEGENKSENGGALLRTGMEVVAEMEPSEWQWEEIEKEILDEFDGVDRESILGTVEIGVETSCPLSGKRERVVLSKMAVAFNVAQCIVSQVQL